MKEGILSVLKFFVFLLVLPLIVASVLAFQIQILGVPVHKEQWILWGVVIFILIYLFLYNLKEVYVFGQTIVSNILKFFEPLASIGGFIIPIYTILIICVYLILNIMNLSSRYEPWLLLALGFSVAMHIVLTANQLHEGDSSPVKGQYFLGFGFALLTNIMVIALLLGIVIPEFSFIGFFNSLSHHTVHFYQMIYKTLFVNSA